MKTIVCPTDFSKASSQVLEYAGAFGQDFNSEITILHVYERPTLYSDLPMKAIRNQEEEYRMEATKKLNAIVEKLRKKYKKVKFETKLLEGNPVTQICAFSRRKHADLILIGKTSESKIKRLLLGSTAAGVIRKAESPVLCVPGGVAFSPIKQIVFATDLHEDNIGSALSITSFAKHFNAEIIFVYVDDENLIHSDEKINEMTAKIKKKIKYAKLSGYITRSTSIVSGIEYFLEKNRPDLLVMFTHARHFPGAVLNQSITKIFSHRTNTPLLSLKVAESPFLDMF